MGRISKAARLQVIVASFEEVHQRERNFQGIKSKERQPFSIRYILSTILRFFPATTQRGATRVPPTVAWTVCLLLHACPPFGKQMRGRASQPITIDHALLENL